MPVTTNRTFVFVALLTSFFVFPGADNQGCQSQKSSDVAQDRVHSNYWVYRDANSDVTFQRAQYRFGSNVGTTLELAPPATVTVKDEKLAWGALLDWYERKQAGYVKDTVFVYTDTEGRALTVTTPPIAEADIPADFPTKLARDKAYDFAWVGEPLGEGETMEVVVARAANKLDFVVWYEKNVGAKSTPLTRENLQKVPAGAAYLGIRRHRDVKLPDGADPGAGGKVTTTYQPLDRAIVLE